MESYSEYLKKKKKNNEEQTAGEKYYQNFVKNNQPETTTASKKQESNIPSWIRASNGIADKILGTGFTATKFDALGTVGQGALSSYEGVSDFGYRELSMKEAQAADVLDFFGANSEKVRKRAVENYKNSLNNDTEDIMNSLKRLSVGDYAGTLTDEELAKKDWIGQNSRLDDIPFARSALQGVGNSLANASMTGYLGGATSNMKGFGKVLLDLAPMYMSASASGESEAIENMKQQGNVNLGQARLYGIMSGVIESGSEAMFGGLGKLSKAMGFSEGALDDVIIKKITDKINNTLLKNGVDLALRGMGEGFEEVASGFFDAIAKKLTYMKDADIKKLWEDEQLWDSFISGALSSILMQSPSTVSSTIQGQETTTGITKNENKVVDAVVEERTKGQELSKKEINEIRKEVREDLQNGYISTDTIEKVLGQDYDRSGDMYIQESYNEQARRRTGFQADLSQYGEKQRRIVQKAIDSGILNDSKKTHSFVDLVSKLAADKDMDFDFVNNQKIKDSGFAVEGKTVNGYVNGKTIGLNIESNQALNKTVGHEITHILEGSELYSELQNKLKEYIGQEQWDARIKDLAETYKNVENADVTKELTADLVGENLFDNEDFVRSLSTNQSLFSKLLNEIKYMVKIATAGSKEKRQLVKLQKTFEDVYRDSKTKTSEGETTFSIAGEQGYKNAENYIKQNYSKEQADKYLKVLNDQTRWFKDKNGNWKYEFDDSDMSLNTKIKFEPNKEYKLSDVLKHDTLFGFYPELANYTVIFSDKLGKNKGGGFNNDTNTIRINADLLSSDKMKTNIEGTLIHEIQHAIQHLEGFDTGASTKLGRKAYYNSLGEIEAADTAYRRYMTEEDRQAIAPESSKNNPKHILYDRYLEKRGTFDKIRDDIRDFIDERVEKNEKTEESDTKNQEYYQRLDDGRRNTNRVLQEEVDNTSFSNNIKYSLNSDAIQNLADITGESYSMLEANLGNDDYSVKNYLTRHTKLVDKYMKDNNITVEPVMKPTGLEQHSDSYRNFVKDNDLSVLKLAKDDELLNRYFEEERKEMDSLPENLRESVIQSQKENFNYAKTWDEVPASLQRYEDEFNLIKNDTKEIVDDWETEKKIQKEVVESPEFQKYLDKLVQPLFHKEAHTVEEVMDEAKYNHGTTDNYEVGAYMTTDGELLDFGDHGYRDDHRTVDAFDLDMNEFMEYGAIRMKPESNGFELATEPTSEQYSKLYDYIDDYCKNNPDNGDIVVDIDTSRNNYDSQFYNINTPTSKIINDIKTYYETGSFPKQSEFADFRYSLSDNDIQAKINQSMTMDEAREMLQRAFVLSDIQDYSDGAVNNIDEWVNNDDWNYQISMIIDSNQDLYNKYIASNEGINNDEYTLDDVIEAYKNGTLTGKVRQDYGRVDTSINTGYTDERFYSPQQIEATNELYEKASQRLTKTNKDEVYKARADFIIAAHDQNVSEQLGIDAKELNSKLKSWANYPSKTLELSKQLNENVSNQNKWSGLENSSIVNDISITDEQLESMVKQVIGKENSNGWKRKYITSAMLALDTHIDYKNLTFDFEQSSKLQEQHAAGDYNNRTNVIRVGSGYQNTVAHEMGHYIDYQWARELFGNENRPLSSISRNYNQEKLTQEQIKFIEHFREFQNNIETKAEMGDTLKYGSSRDASYWQEPTETFARFVGKFTEWVKNQATNNRYGYEEKHYTDKFTESQYKEFVKILQEKSALDTTMEKRYGTYNQDSIAIMDSITPEQRAELKQAFDELDNEQTPSYQLTERIQDIIGKDNYYKLSNEQLKNIANDTQFSLSQQNEVAPTRGWNIQGRDIALEQALAPVKEQLNQLQDIVQELAPITEQEAANLPVDENIEAPTRYNLTADESEELDALEKLNNRGWLNQENKDRYDELKAKEVEIPSGDNLTPIQSLNDVRDIDEVGKRTVNAYQYEHPEVKPFFREEARKMLTDLNNTVRGEKYAIPGQSKNINDWEWIGIKRQTSPEIAALLDGEMGVKYSYDDIRKGLNAIIADSGAENIAVAKRIEFLLDERLRNGYDQWDAVDENYEPYHVEPNQEYLNMLKEQAWEKYYDEIPFETYPIEPEPTIEREQDLAPTQEPVAPTPVDALFMPEQQINRELTQPAKRKIEPRKKSAIRQALETLTGGFVNRNVLVDDISKRSGNDSIRYKGDMWSNYMSEAERNINSYQTDINGKAVGDSVNKLFDDAKKAGIPEAVFNEFLIDYSNIDRWRQNKGSQTPYEESAKRLRDYAIKYPQIKQYAKQVWKFGRNSLQNRVDAGLMTQETADYLKKIYPHYVPYISQADDIGVYYSQLNELKPQSIKRARGGAGALMPVQEALAKYVTQEKRSIRQNALFNSLIDVFGEGNNFGADKADYTGMEDSLFMDEGKAYLTAYKDGKQRTTQIDMDLYNELNRTADNQIKDMENRLSLITKPLQWVSNLRRNFLTSYNPTFALFKNPAKDVQDAAYYSKHTKDMLKNLPSSYKEMFTESTDLAKQFKSLYGAAEYEGFGKNYAKLSEAIELAPRFAEFKASLENGASLEEALYNARDVTTNFSRGGTITKAMNRNGFTFLNASIQGFDKFIRNFSEQQDAKGYASVLAKTVALSILPAIFNDLAFGSGDDKDEEYEALPDYIKDNYYLFKLGNGKFLRIPKGRALSIFGSAARRTLEYAQGEEDAFDGFFKNAWSQIAPVEVSGNPLDNTILAPIAQAFWSGKNGRQWYDQDVSIVPSRLQDEKPEDQYDASIDSLSIWLGQKTGISPYKINYVLDQYSGGVGDALLPLMTKESTNEGGLLAPIKDQLEVNSTDDNKYVSDFYSKKEELTTKAKGSKATDEDKLQQKYLDAISTEMAELYKEKREVQNDDSLTKKEKYRKASEIKNQINSLAKEGLDNYQNVEIDGDYGEVNGVSYQKGEDGKWKKVKEGTSNDTQALGLRADEKDNYVKTTDNIKTIKKQYSNSTVRKQKVIGEIRNSNLPNEAKVQLYKENYTDQMVDNYMDMGMDINSYLDYKSQEFTADKDRNGKSISGSKKQKVFDYINNMNIPFEQKVMLVKQEYPNYNEYNEDIINYLNKNKNIDYDQERIILENLGFKVDSDGNISW